MPTDAECIICKRRMYMLVIIIAVLAGIGGDQISSYLALLI